MKKSLLHFLLTVLVLLAPYATIQAEDLTVNDGTATNEYVPLYGYYADTSGKSQFVVSADAASDMANGSISGMSFYASSDFSFTGIWEVRLMETNATSVSSDFLDVSSATLVYTGTIAVSGGVAPITFDEAFDYEDGNILVEVSLKTQGNCSTSGALLWYGVSGQSRGGSGSYPASRTFVPKTTFTYTPGAPAACPKPKSLSYSDLQKRQVQLSWTESGTATAWQICLNNDESNLRSADSNPYVLSGLDPETQYSVKVRANCGGQDGDSEWSNEIQFTTPVACAVPVFGSSPISNVTKNSADLSWEGTAENGFKVLYRTAAYIDGLDEKFDGSSIPADWSMYTGLFNEADGTATLVSGSGWSFGTGNGVFDSHARVNIYGTSCQRWLVSPIYKQKVANLTFNLALTAYSGDNVPEPATDGTDDKFIVLVQEAGSDTWTVLRKWDNAVGSEYVYNDIKNSAKGEDVEIDMSAYKNRNIRIAFYGESTVSNADNYLHIDNISSGNAYAAGVWQEKGSSNNNITLSELESDKPYEVKIQANCGQEDGNSEESEIVSFTTIGSCEKATSLVAGDITVDAATISWDGAGQSEFNLRYRIKGSNSWTEANNIAGASYGLSSLEANTRYQVEVQPICAEADIWSDTYEFLTACGSYQALGWSEDFENADQFLCWTVGNMQSTSLSYIPSRGSSYKHEGSSGLQLYAYYSSYYSTNADSAYAILPALDYGQKSLKDFSMSLWARSSSSGTTYNQHLLVGVVSSPDEMSSFEQVAEIEVSTSYAQYELNFSSYDGNGQYIVLLAVLPSGTGTRYGQFYVDDLSLFLTPSCQPLASIAISDVERRSLKVNLQPKAGLELADQYDLVCSASELDAAGLAEASFVSISKDAFPYTINGLERETPYYIYVRANCGTEDGVSEWVSANATTKGLNACDEVVVGSGAGTSSYVPTHSNYDYSLTEQIYTPAEIGQSGNISSIAFYNSGSEKTRTIDVYMLHTDKAAFESTTDWVHVANEQKVFSGSVTFAAGAWTTLTLSSPFAYNGEDNLLIVVDDNSDSYSSGLSCRTFTGSAGQVLYKYQDNTNIDPTNTTITGTLSSAKNQIQFSFCYDLPACPAVSELEYELVGEGTSEANVTWSISDADYLSGFEVVLSENDEITDFSEVTKTQTQEDHITFNTLSAGTHYWVYVRAICQAESHDDGNSEWAGIDFITNADCPEVHNLSAELSGLNAVNAAWELAFAEQEKHFQYILSTTELDADALGAGNPTAVDDATEVVIAELEYNQQYHLYVASVCGAAHSAYEHVSFTTMPSCPAVENIAAVRIEHNLVELSWESAPFANESSWQVGLVGDEANAQTVSERKAVLFGLDPEMGYTAFVKAICSEASEAANVTFTTAAQPAPCTQIGSGTSTTYYYPINNYYKYSYSQQIFDAEELQKGNITAISFQYAYSTAMTKATDVTIYMGVTSKSEFANTSDWVALADLTEVYQGALNCSQGWNDFTLQTPFNYNGSGNLVLAVHDNTEAYDGNSYTFYNTSVSTNKTLYYQSDYTACPANAPVSGTLAKSRNNIKFCFEEKACPDVKALAISDITTSSAKASWEPMGSEKAWNVVIATGEVSDFSGVTAEQVNALSKTFDGLNNDQDYFVYVQPADCESAEFSMVSFRTIASCKTVINPQAPSPYITVHSAYIAWEDPNENAAWGYLIAYGPAEDFDLSDENTYQTYDGSDFILKNLSAETEYKFAVKVFCDQDHLDASRWSEIASFTTLPSCYAPTAVAVDQASITTNSASVSWTDDHAYNPDETPAYIVAYGPAASFDISNSDTYETAIAEAKSLELTGLNPAKAYTFMVMGDCSSFNGGYSSSWSPAGEFTTACEAIVSFPWSEDFDGRTNGNIAFDCWTNEHISGSGSYIFQVADGTGGNSTKLGKLPDMSSGTITDLTLPVMSLSAANAYEFIIDVYRNASGTSYPGEGLRILAVQGEESTELGFISRNWEQSSTIGEVVVVPAESATGWYTYRFTIPYADAMNIVVRGESKYGSATYFDNLIVRELPSCEKPTGLALGADGVSTSSAQLTWTAGGNETNWKLRYKKQSEEEWTVISDAITANPYMLEGLDAATAYDVQIAAWCNTEDAEAISEFSASFSFTTACEAIASFPWNEDFNSLSAGIPVCWDNSEGTTTEASYKWNYYASGHEGKGLRFNSYSNSSNNTNILKTPTFVIADKGLILSFWYMNPAGGDFSVYYAIGDDEPVALAIGLTGISAWTLKEITLPTECLNNDVVFLFKGTSNYGYGDAYIYLDDVKVEEVPECVKPTGLALGADGVSTSSAQLTWTAGGNETNWKLRYKKQTDEEWTVISDPITANPYTLTGLDAATAYDVQIAAWCNIEDAEAISEFSAALSFFTACEAIASFPWNENFDGRTNGNINFDCWTNEHISGSGSYIFQVADGTGGNSTKLGKLPDMSSGTITDLTLPVMSLPAANAYEFIIDVYRNASGTSYPGEGLRILAVQGEESTELGFISRNWEQSSTIGEVVVVPAESATGWYTYRFTIPYADAMNIVVRGESKYGSATYFDNLIVRELPSCEKPTGLAIGAEGVSTHSAQLAWTAGEAEQSAWQICLNGDEENLIDADTNPFVLSNLTAATVYNAKVRANCGGSFSEWSNTVAFATEVCEEADKKSIRYVLTDQYNDTWNGASITVKDKITNAEVAVVTMSSSTASEEGVVNLCCDREYSFVFASGSYPKECGYVFYDLNGDVILQKTTGATAPSAGVMRDYTMFCPSCFKPTAIHASGITASSAVISWTEGADEEAWEIAYSTDADFDPNAATLADATATSITLSELTASTPYYVYVRANCGDEDKSAWSERFYFTTVADCQVPGDLSVEGITESSASISWNGYGQSGFTLRYSKDGDSWASIENAASPQLIEGLDANTAYQVQVQVDCNTEEEWSETLNFKTACGVYSIATDGEYAEDFNSYAGSTSATTPSAYPNDELPECWQFLNRSANMSSYPQVFISSNSGYPVSGKCLFFKSSSTTPLYAVLPKFAENTASLQLKFTYRNEGTSDYNGTLYAGYMTDPTDATTFNAVLTCEQTTTLTEKELFFDGAPEGSYIAFKYEGGTSNNYYLSIDNVSVSLAPTCFKPSALTIADITTHSAKLSWTNGKNESAWQICVNDDETNLIDVNDENSFTLNSLTQNTAYSVKVRANCGQDDQSEWSEAVSFTTDCEAITALPWEENFNDKQKDKVADCWDNSASASTTAAGANSHFVWGVHEYSGNKMIRMYNYNVNSGTALINTPNIVLPEGDKYELSFDYSNRADCGDFKVKISVDGGVSFAELDDASYAAAGTTSNLNPGTFSHATINLSAYAGQTIMLQFFANANNGNGAIFVDNISLHVKAPCSEAPTALNASTADANAIHLSWTKGEDEEAWSARYRIVGSNSAWTVVNEIATVVAGANCSATLSGLEPETSYEIQVQAYCDAEHQSEWTASAVASTACGVKALPYIEDFDGLSVGIPACWDNTEGSTDNNSYRWNYVAAGHEGSAVRFNSFNNPSGKTNFLKTPAIAISASAALNFWYKNETGGDFSILYSINGNELVALESGLPNCDEWTHHSIQLPDACVGQEVVLIFKGTSNNSYGSEPYIYLDEVSVVRTLVLNDAVDNEATLESNKGEVMDITINRTFFRKGYFNTICLPFDLPSFENTPFDVPGAELWAFKYGYVENGELLIRIIEADAITAGVPYLIRFENADEDIVNPTFHGVTISESVGRNVGQNDDVRFIGILKPEWFAAETAADEHKKLFLLTGDRLAWAGTANNLKSFRAFFLTQEAVSGAPVSNNMPARLVMRDQTATGTEGVQSEQQVLKRIENDQVVIIRNGVKYSAQGQLIEK